MKARGNFTVDMQWKASRLTEAVVTSEVGESCRLRTARPIQVVSKGKPVAVKELADGLVAFPTEPGGKFTIRPK